ncbi:MAG: cysteine hydrolase [Clostridia bacterium]|nr:cysteine hydrolase [Clostridia bacterium]
MKKVLIVIDMQNDFVTGALANKDALAIVESVAQMVANFDGDVIATRDTHGADYLNTTEGKFLPVEHCIAGSDGWQIVDKIKTEIDKRGGIVIDKPTFGYKDWQLDGYDVAEIVGTCTDICVVSNALILKALYPDMQVVVHGSLCAGLTPQKHAHALDVMASCQCKVI